MAIATNEPKEANPKRPKIMVAAMSTLRCSLSPHFSQSVKADIVPQLLHLLILTILFNPFCYFAHPPAVAEPVHDQVDGQARPGYEYNVGISWVLIVS